MYCSNERKIEIIFNIDENTQHLPKLGDQRYKYSQVHKKQGFLRYYSAGVHVQPTELFRRQLVRETDAPMFRTPLVLSLSVDSKIQPDNQTVFKTSRRVYIPFGINVQSIRLDGMSYNSFPLATDYDHIKIDQCTIDLNLKQAKITGIVSVEFSIEETDYDKFKYFQERVVPLNAHIAKIMNRPELNLYENSYITNEVFKMMTTIMKNFDLLHSSNYELNRPLRERLANLLIDADVASIGPNNNILLTESTEADINRKKKQPYAMGLYEYKGAFFKDRQEFESSMKYAEMMDQTEDEIIASKKRDNRYEYMMVFLDENQRIHEITEQEINDAEDVIYAMTESERDEYELLRTMDTEQGKAARLELARTAKLRWKVANGRV